MEIILLEDVKTLGKKGETMTVKDGYGRSLIGKKQAIEATAKNINDLKLRKIHEEKLEAQRLLDAQELAGKLAGLSVNLTVKVGKDGKLFGSVSTKEIADACKAQLNLDVDKKKLVLPEPIKELGKTVVPLKLHPQVTASLNVVVAAE